ncbi:MAG: GNAT family N-acetyltransferase [Rhodospirillales bacterium]
MSVLLRKARPADAEGIAAVHVETWRTTYAGLIPDRYLLDLSPEIQAARWRRLIARPSPKDETLVIDGGAEGILGFGSSGPARQAGAPARAEIYTLYVAGDRQGRGFGRALLTQLLRGLHRRGFPDAFLWVLSGNPARFFYQALGGQRAGRQDEPFAGTRLSEEAYCWPDLASWLTERAEGDRRSS